MFQFVENIPLKNYDDKKFIQILIGAIILILVQIILISRKWD